MLGFCWFVDPLTFSVDAESSIEVSDEVATYWKTLHPFLQMESVESKKKEQKTPVVINDEVAIDDLVEEASQEELQKSKKK